MIVRTEPDRPVVARAWWIIGLAESSPQVIVAPLGRYSPAFARDLGGGLAGFLGIQRVDLGAPGAAEALAGWGWVEVGGKPAWEVPSPRAPRALLVGRRSPARIVGRYGPRPFEDGAGEQLARALAIGELAALLGTFETAYDDDLVAGRLRGRHVVALDVEPAALDGCEEAATCVALDRSMSRNTVSGGLLRATIAARRSLGAPSELEAEVVALAGAGDGPGPCIAPALRRAWDLAGPAGLAWPGSAPGTGWQPKPDVWPREMMRDFSGVVAEVMGPKSPGAFRALWRATATGPAGRVGRDCVDLESAILVAERLARTLGGMTPWDRRDVGLALAWREQQAEGDA